MNASRTSVHHGKTLYCFYVLTRWMPEMMPWILEDVDYSTITAIAALLALAED